MFDDEISDLIKSIDRTRVNDINGGRMPAPMIPVEHNRSDDKSAPPPPQKKE